MGGWCRIPRALFDPFVRFRGTRADTDRYHRVPIDPKDNPTRPHRLVRFERRINNILRNLRRTRCCILRVDIKYVICDL